MQESCVRSREKLAEGACPPWYVVAPAPQHLAADGDDLEVGEDDDHDVAEAVVGGTQGRDHHQREHDHRRDARRRQRDARQPPLPLRQGVTWTSSTKFSCGTCAGVTGDRFEQLTAIQLQAMIEHKHRVCRRACWAPRQSRWVWPCILEGYKRAW